MHFNVLKFDDMIHKGAFTQMRCDNAMRQCD